MPSLTQRRLTPELMDDPDADPCELACSLRFLRFANRYLGGTRASLAPLRAWSRSWPAGQAVSVLDVGTGSADIPLALLRWAARRGHSLHVVGIDSHHATLDLARKHVGEAEGIELLQCDALKLTERFEPGSFDYAHAGLFLHHLPDIEVMTVLRSMDRLTRRGIIWNDLMRTRIAMLGVKLVTLMPGVPHMARHDAIVSIEAAFTAREAIDLGRRVGLQDIRCRTHGLHRFTLTSTKG